MRLIAALLLSLGLLISPVVAAPIDRLVADALKTGTAAEIEGSIFHTLSFVAPADESKPRIARYFSVITEGDAVGGFAISYEKWDLDAKGNWRIEQWEFLLGSRTTAGHDILHETKDRVVLGEENLGPKSGSKKDLEAFSAEAAEVLDREISFWSSRVSI